MLRSILGWAGISGASWVFFWDTMETLGPLGILGSLSVRDCGLWGFWVLSLGRASVYGSSGVLLVSL